MIRGASATGFFGNSTSSSAPVRIPADKASTSERWWRPTIPPAPVQKIPNAMWTLNWPNTNSSSDQPSLPSGRFVDSSPIALIDQREELELQRAGVLAAGRVDEQEPAALDHAGVEDQPDAPRRSEADEVVEVLDAVAELLERERHADPVDRGGERSEREREPAPDVQGHLRLRHQLQLEELDGEHAEQRRRHRQVDPQPGAALEADAR